ncbi:spore coat protein [bacterium]|nr:spore coat protein [bacterium]
MTIGILQARLSSSRFPGKVLMEINSKPMIYWQLERVRKAKLISEIVVATSSLKSDDSLVSYLESINQPFVRGSLNNVKSRFDKVLNKYSCDQFVRLTADCPMVMPSLVDDLIKRFKSSNLDYLSNTLAPTYPDGLDVEIIRTRPFMRLGSKALSDIEKEHVTYAMYSRKGQFLVENYKNEVNLSHLRWTVDYKEDFDFVSNVFAHFKGYESKFTMNDVLDLLSSKPHLKSSIDGSRRNESLNKEITFGPRGNHKQIL